MGAEQRDGHHHRGAPHRRRRRTAGGNLGVAHHHRLPGHHRADGRGPDPAELSRRQGQGGAPRRLAHRSRPSRSRRPRAPAPPCCRWRRDCASSCRMLPAGLHGRGHDLVGHDHDDDAEHGHRGDGEDGAPAPGRRLGGPRRDAGPAPDDDGDLHAVGHRARRRARPSSSRGGGQAHRRTRSCRRPACTSAAPLSDSSLVNANVVSAGMVVPVRQQDPQHASRGCREPAAGARARRPLSPARRRPPCAADGSGRSARASPRAICSRPTSTTREPCGSIPQGSPGAWRRASARTSAPTDSPPAGTQLSQYGATIASRGVAAGWIHDRYPAAQSSTSTPSASASATSSSPAGVDAPLVPRRSSAARRGTLAPARRRGGRRRSSRSSVAEHRLARLLDSTYWSPRWCPARSVSLLGGRAAGRRQNGRSPPTAGAPRRSAPGARPRSAAPSR